MATIGVRKQRGLLWSECKEYTEVNEGRTESKKGRRSEEGSTSSREVVAAPGSIQWNCGPERGSIGDQRRVRMR